MHRYLRRTAFRWSPIADSVVIPETPRQRVLQKNGTFRMEFLQFSDTRGYCNSSHEQQLTTRCTQLQIVRALRLGERERASNMLLNLVHENISLKAKDFTHILEYSARTPDPLFAMQTWRVMGDKAIRIDKRCWLLIIQALSNGGYLKEAFSWLSFLGENECTQPALPIYNIFLEGCAKSQNLVYAEYCLDLMESQFMGKSEITYWELLKLAVWQGNLSTAHEIWRDFTKNYSPGIKSMRNFIWSFIKLKDLKSAYGALQHMVALAMQGSSSFVISSEEKYRCPKLDIPIPSINKLPDEKLSMEFELCVPSAFFGSSEKTKQSLGGNCGRGSQSVYTMDENSNLDSAVRDQFHALDTTDIAYIETIGSEPAVEVEKDCSNSQCFQPIKSAAASRNHYLAVKPDERASFTMENSELKDMRFALVKDILTIPVKKLLRWSFGDLIHACAQSQNCELAEQLFLQMRKLGLEPSEHTYDGIVKAVITEKGVTYAMDIFKEMEKRKLKPLNDTLAALSIGCSKTLKLDLAESLLDQISDSSQKYIYPFNALLSSCDVMNQPERAVCVLSKMKNLNIKPNTRTYELLFSLFGNVNAPYEKGNILSHIDVTKRIRVIETDMMKTGIQHSPLSVANLLRALGAEGMIRELLHYLNVTENLFFQTKPFPVTAIYNTVLHALIEARESDTAIQIFENMRSADCPPDAATYNIMIDCCSILGCFKSASALVSLMLRDGFCPKTCTYTALIKILLANDDFDRALRLLDQSKSEGVQHDVLLFNTILLGAYLKGHIDIIELLLEQMHQEKIKPDQSTCWYAFAAYADRCFFSTAVEALQILSLRMISDEDGIIFQEKRDEFESLVQSEDPDVELQIIEIFKGSDVNLAAALFNLRWCAIAGYSISWFPEESSWARRLSSHYGPGKGTTG